MVYTVEIVTKRSNKQWVLLKSFIGV